MSRKFLIETDTASDDAVALIMALRAPDVEVVAVTVVSGNAPTTGRCVPPRGDQRSVPPKGYEHATELRR